MSRTAWLGTGTAAVIGMVHLRALPGAPRYGGDLAAVREAALRDAEALAAGGVQALMMENYGDVPFYPGRVPPYVVAHMTAIADELIARFGLPLGINVLRNDGLSALAIAHASGAAFIRVNVLCGARVTDQGLLQGIAHDLMRERAFLGATAIKILADIDVKHSAPLAPRPLEAEVSDAIDRGLADGLIVSGVGTGHAANPQQARAVKAFAPATPVLIGSGVSADNIQDYRTTADGFIVGSSLKIDGKVDNAIDVKRVRELMGRLK